MRIWYRVRNLERARAFYVDVLGFEETYSDDEGWIALDHGTTEIALSEGEPLDEEGGVAVVDVEDVKGERERLAAAGFHVGTAVELHGAVRVVDVLDEDGNRIQLSEEVT